MDLIGGVGVWAIQMMENSFTPISTFHSEREGRCRMKSQEVEMQKTPTDRPTTAFISAYVELQKSR